MMRIKPFLFLLIAFSILLSCNEKETRKDENQDKNEVTAFENPPEWSKNVIWYQIFVERFRNGDPTNDPTAEDIAGSYPGFVPEGWAITPWTQDWYKEDEYCKNIGDQTDFNGNKLTYFDQKLQLRRYGGDLQGVLDMMDYIEELGVTAIYFNPLNDAPSLHKYDARNWRHIDKNFGPNPEKDAETMANEIPDNPSTWEFTEADKLFLKIIDEFHKRGIKVILDYSWNHTGQTFWAWQDLVKNQEESKYKDWYWVKEFDNPETAENEFSYTGWLNVKTLPEIKETEYIDHSNGIVPAEGNILSNEAKQHIFAVTKRWLDPNGDGDPSDGVDGYRLDVAAEIPFGFWREYREVVREVNPNAYILGEVWWEVWPDRLLDPKPFLEGDIFDAVMNYRWFRNARHFFNSSPNKMPVSTFVKKLDSINSNLRVENVYSMMNLVASHDVPRVLTSLYNKNKYKFNSTPSADPNYKIDKPDNEIYQTLKLLLVHQYTYIGSPHIWAGDEMGMWGADDPSPRKPLIWQDYNFEDEKTHPLGMERPVNKVQFDTTLFNFYKKLIKIRKNNSVLSSGKIDFVIVDDENEVLAYSRYDENDETISVFNTSFEEKEIEIPVKFNADYSEILNNFEINKTNDKIILTLPARTSAIFKCTFK